jgi:hypothetical protein
MSCEKKMLLANALSVAAEQLSLTTLLLDARIGVALKQEYEILRSRAERARAATDRARGALNAHAAQHGC